MEHFELSVKCVNEIDYVLIYMIRIQKRNARTRSRSHRSTIVLVDILLRQRADDDLVDIGHQRERERERDLSS